MVSRNRATKRGQEKVNDSDGLNLTVRKAIAMTGGVRCRELSHSSSAIICSFPSATSMGRAQA